MPLKSTHNKIKKIIIKTEVISDNQVSISVQDNGIGINEEDLSKIFTYGFTTKESGHGIGLHSSSLSTHDSNGTLTASSLGTNQGSTFTLTLPIKNEIKIEK